jgi:ABC-type transport system involved in multi-copper enzyme maturation permease subunit
MSVANGTRAKGSLRAAACPVASPARAMSPILRRELIGLLRTRRAFWLLTLSVALSGALPLVAWPRADRFGARPDTSSVILWLFLTQLAAALCLLPAFAGGAFIGERERGTYELLVSTKLSTRAIVGSKFLASMGCIAIFLLATAPSACSLHLLGGASLGTLLWCYVVTLVAVSVGTAVCLHQSLRAKSTTQGVALGFLWVALWSTGPLVVAGAMIRGGCRVLTVLFADLRFYDPNQSGKITRWGVVADAVSWWSAIVIVGPLALGAFIVAPTIALFAVGIFFGGLLPGSSPFTVIASLIRSERGARLHLGVYLVYAAVVSFCYLRILFRDADAAEARRLNALEEWNLSQASPGVPLDSMRTPAPRRSWFTRAAMGLGRRGFAPFRNPVFLKELQTLFHGGIEYRTWLFLGCCALFGLLGLMGGARYLVAGATGLAILILPAIAAPSFTREAELGSLDLLRGSLLSAWEVVEGKLLAALSSVAGIVAAAGWVLVTMTASSAKSDMRSGIAPAAALLSILVHFAVTAFVAAYSMFASVISRRSLQALLLAYAPLLALYVGLPFVLQLSARTAATTADWLRLLDPFLVLSRLAASRSAAMRGAAAFDVVAFVSIHAAGAAAFCILAWIRLRRLRPGDV